MPQEYTYEIFKGAKSLGQRTVTVGSMSAGAISEPFVIIPLAASDPGSYRVKLEPRTPNPEPFSASVEVRRVY